MEYKCTVCSVSIKGPTNRLRQHFEKVHAIERLIGREPFQRVAEPVRRPITITELGEAQELLGALSWSGCLGLSAVWYVHQNKRPTTINELAKFTRGRGPHGIEGLRQRKRFARKLAKMLSSYGLLGWRDEKTLVPLVSQLLFEITKEPKETVFLDNILGAREWLRSIYGQQIKVDCLLDRKVVITFPSTSIPITLHETKPHEKPSLQAGTPSRLELTATQIDDIMERVEELTFLKECDHALTISLGFKPSFSEGAASVLLECRKCGKRIQQNL